MSADENLVDHILPTYLAGGTTWGTHENLGGTS